MKATRHLKKNVESASHETKYSEGATGPCDSQGLTPDPDLHLTESLSLVPTAGPSGHG